jgi:hypothetical protein
MAADAKGASYSRICSLAAIMDGRKRWRPSRACAREAVLGTLRVAGFQAWALWLLVHLMTLTGFKNPLSVLFN